jgi:hypothetical protein
VDTTSGNASVGNRSSLGNGSSSGERSWVGPLATHDGGVVASGSVPRPRSRLPWIGGVALLAIVAVGGVLWIGREPPPVGPLLGAGVGLAGPGIQGPGVQGPSGPGVQGPGPSGGNSAQPQGLPPQGLDGAELDPKRSAAPPDSSASGAVNPSPSGAEGENTGDTQPRKGPPTKGRPKPRPVKPTKPPAGVTAKPPTDPKKPIDLGF